MKIPSRVLVPVLCAILCAGMLIGLLWWQLWQSTFLLSQSVQPHDDNEQNTQFIVGDMPVDPRDKALLHLRRGDLMALQGEWTEALKEYEGAVREGGGLAALRKLAQAQLQRRDIRGAKRTIDQLKREGARNEDVLLLESIVHLRTGELVRARKLLDSSAESPQKSYGLSLLAILEGDHERASLVLQDVINGWEPVLRSYAHTLQAAYNEYALFPESPNIHLITLLARSLAQVQECELALPLLVQVTQTSDDYRDAWIVQGYCEFVTERYEQALHSFERAYGLDPEKPEIQYFLGRTYAKLGNIRTAITFLNYAITNGFEPKNEVRRLIETLALASGDEMLIHQYAGGSPPNASGSTTTVQNKSEAP